MFMNDAGGIRASQDFKFVCILSAPTYVYCVPALPTEAGEGLDTLGRELQAVVSCFVGDGTRTQALC